jgi:hypothetical protein
VQRKYRYFQRGSVEIGSRFLVTSSPSSCKELPTSKVAGGISMGLIFFRSEGTLSFMLSHLTLRMQAHMKQYAIQSLSLLSASGLNNILTKILYFHSLPSPILRSGNSSSQMLKLSGSRDIIRKVRASNSLAEESMVVAFLAQFLIKKMKKSQFLFLLK